MRARAAIVSLLVALAGCSEDTAVDEVKALAPFRHETFYEQLREDAEAFTLRDGEWLEDYGDAPFYGLGFYALTTDPASERVQAARAHAAAQLYDVDFFSADLQEVLMSGLGLTEYVAASGDETDVPLLDEFVGRLDGLLELVGFYLEPGAIDSWALDTYGSTAVSALIGLVNTEYVLRVGGDSAEERLAWAVEMADHIHDCAWDGSAYAFGPDRPGFLDLYPNIAMMALEARLARLTGEARHLERAEAAYQGIQPLNLLRSPVRYASPYAADIMGATTDDFATLSSQNYLMLGLALLYEVTGDPAYVEELDGVLDALSTQTYGTWCLSDVHAEACSPVCAAEDVCVVDDCSADRCDEGVLHHWIDGRPALPSDPSFFCSGCNLQLLYVMSYRRDRLPAGI